MNFSTTRYLQLQPCFKKYFHNTWMLFITIQIIKRWYVLDKGATVPAEISIGNLQAPFPLLQRLINTKNTTADSLSLSPKTQFASFRKKCELHKNHMYLPRALGKDVLSFEIISTDASSRSELMKLAQVCQHNWYFN